MEAQSRLQEYMQWGLSYDQAWSIIELEDLAKWIYQRKSPKLTHPTFTTKESNTLDKTAL